MTLHADRLGQAFAHVAARLDAYARNRAQPLAAPALPDDAPVPGSALDILVGWFDLSAFERLVLVLAAGAGSVLVAAASASARRLSPTGRPSRRLEALERAVVPTVVRRLAAAALGVGVLSGVGAPLARAEDVEGEPCVDGVQVVPQRRPRRRLPAVLPRQRQDAFQQSPQLQAFAQLEVDLGDLHEFAGRLLSEEEGGKKFTASDADTLGSEAQRNAEAIAGQVSQAAGQLGLKLED